MTVREQSQKRLVDAGMRVTIEVEIEEDVRKRAVGHLADCGLTVEEALRIMLVQIAAGREFGFEPLEPNRETISAIEAARRGELVTLGTPAEAMAELNRA